MKSYIPEMSEDDFAATSWGGKPTEVFQAEPIGSAGILLTGLFPLFLGYLCTLFAGSDLFQIPIYGDRYVSSPLELITTSPRDLWIIYVFGIVTVSAGAVCVGSQPFIPEMAAVYVMFPLAGIVTLAGWPLRTRTYWRESIAVVCMGLGGALLVDGVLGIQSQMEYGRNDHISFHSLAIQIGLTTFAGGSLAWNSERRLSKELAEVEPEGVSVQSERGTSGSPDR